MNISSDYKDLFKILNTYKVQYLVVGAYAVTYYTEPRFTKDLDLWINPDIKNATKLYTALKKFGAPLKGIEIEDFMNEELIYQVGVAPIRVDILMGLNGIKFYLAWKSRKKSKYGKIPINILGMKELINSKKRSNRLQDRLDLKHLLAIIHKT